MKTRLLFFGLILLCVIPFNAHACHGLALLNVSVTTGGGNITLDANSDPASCGCGPYYMEVEVSYSTTFTGAAPVYTSPAWGTFPWYHSLLNVPNYNAANGWPDNCVLEPYSTITIPMSSFCAGSTIYLRMREHVVGSGSSGPWTAPASVSIPGTPIMLAGSASVNDSTLCPGDTALLSVSSNGCSGIYTISWSPTTGLGDPSAATTTAFPSSTTTYTVSFTDVGLSQTFTSSVTIYASATNPSAAFTSGIATCNQSDAWVNTVVSGGTSPYTFLWSNAATTQNLSSIASGTYSLTITDLLGCFTDTSAVITDSCDYVWPGDANDDAVADMNDILAIGIANGSSGTTRPNASIVWIGQPSAPWGPTLTNGTDYKWVDCNGDGTINANDTTAVLLNYGYTHTNRIASEFPQTSPDVHMKFVPDTLSPSSPGTVQILLGDAITPVNNVYGIALAINYDETYIDPNSISLSLSGSWMGTAAVNLIGVKKTILPGGRVEFAITRIDQQNISGNGLIATIHFMTTSALTGTGQTVITPASLQYINCIDAAESQMTLNTISDSLVIMDLTTSIPGFSPANFSIAPNPAGNQVQLRFNTAAERTITVKDMLGREIISVLSNEVFTSLDLSALSAGTYLVVVQDGSSIHAERLVVKKN